MADRATVSYFAMYVIGEVESNWTWTSVNYSDPITIGMMQWYGVRAAELMNAIKNQQPAIFSQVSQSLQNDLNTYGTGSFWNSRYLTQAEGNSLVAILGTTEVKAIQENIALNDFDAYITRMENLGFSLSNPKPLIFAMSMYHQSPRSCGEVVSTCGGSASLSLIYQTAMNHYILGQYSNRQTTVYNRLNAWDGNSMPPDFGQVGGGSIGGNPVPNPDGTLVGQQPNELSHIIQVGDDLILYGVNTYKDGVIFHSSAGQMWRCTRNAGTAPPITGGNTGGGNNPTAQAIIDYGMSKLGQWYYGQGAGRLSPESSGYTDCSAFIWWCFHHIAGISIGQWTGAQVNDGALVWQGGKSGIPWSSFQLCDLFLFGQDGDFGAPSHVELYIGNNQFIGAGYDPLPYVSNAPNFVANDHRNTFMVRRIAGLS